jgi:hypothetical protein
MKKMLLISLTVLACNILKAQDPTVKDLQKDASKTIKKDEKDTIPQKWKLGGNLSLTINQGALSNWSAGGEEFSFSLNSYMNLYAFYKEGKHSWDNSLDLAYGFVQTTSLGNRKASDRIDLTSKYGYAISKHVNVAALLNFRSQFAKGYSYDETPEGKDTATLTSKSFMPAYLVLSLGLDYKPNADLSVFVSPITGRWIFVGDKLLGPDYGLDPGETVKTEVGAFLSVNYFKKFHENLTFKSKLDLFSNYLDKPQNIDIFWSNVLTAKITKYINFSLNVDMIYDDNTQNVNPDKGPAAQWLELMGIGIAYTFKNSKAK